MSDYSWNMSDLENALGITYDELDDEIKGMDESKALKTFKTNEEIERFIVDERLSEVEKAVHLMKCGSIIQKTWVMNELANFYSSHAKEFYSKILSEVLNVILTENIQVQKSFCQNITVILSSPNEFQLDPQFVKESLYPCLKKLTSAYPNDEEWEEALLLTLDFMDQDTLINDIYSSSVSNAGMSKSVVNRLWCCKVIGKLAKRIPVGLVESICLKKALELSQDTDHEVRSCMSLQLSRIASVLSWEKSRSLIFNDYRELLVDEQEEVRLTALENLPVFLEMMDPDGRKKLIWPLWKQWLEDSLTFSIEEIISKDFGLYFWSLKDVLDQSEKLFLAKRYHEIVKSGSAKLRILAAYNLPALSKIAGPDHFESFGILAIMKTFQDDQCVDVKRKYAQGFHEIASILGEAATKPLREILGKLISCPDFSVVRFALQNIDISLVHLKDDKEDYMPNELFTCISNLVGDHAKKLKWRDQKELFSSYQKIVHFFDSEAEYNFASKILIPSLLPENNSRPVSKSIIKSILCFCRLMRRNEFRERLLKDVVQEFCKYALQLCSRRFFRDHLLSNYLDMCRDSTVNVRLKMVQLSWEVRKCFKPLNKEHNLALKWIESFSKLAQDPDEQVKELAKQLLNHPLEYTESSEFKVIKGSLSRSENYLNHSREVENSEENLDLEKEEEEDRYKMQQIHLEEAIRRRELEEAKNDFSRRLQAERRNSFVTKSTGTGIKSIKKAPTAIASSGTPPSKTILNSGSSSAITKSISFATIGNQTQTTNQTAKTSSTKTAESNYSITSSAAIVSSKGSVVVSSNPKSNVDSPLTIKKNVEGAKSAQDMSPKSRGIRTSKEKLSSNSPVTSAKETIRQPSSKLGTGKTK